MSDFRHKIAFIIPTRNRPEFLLRLLQSLQEQTVRADQVIIVDGSDQPIDTKIMQFLAQGVYYLRVFPPSRTKQRNEGIKAVDENITLVGYLDDDIVLERDTLETILTFWENAAEDVGGSYCNIINTPPSRITLLNKLFCMSKDEYGAVLRSGYNTRIAPVLRDTYTTWCGSAATVWRRQILEEFKWDEWFKGWAYGEDYDFSFRVAQKYKLIILEAARVKHLPSAFIIKKRHSYAKMTIINRYYIVKKHTNYFSVPLFYWAAIGVILQNVLSAIKKRSLDRILWASGTIAGLFSIITGNLVQIDEKFKDY